MLNSFSCPRSCPAAGERWCRFRPVLDVLGSVQVDSHTARVSVEYRDPDILERAVLSLGWTWIGHGTHKLFESTPIVGQAFKIPGWNYPVVLAGGELHHDTFNGSWGNVADLERLTPAYAEAAIEQAAIAQGWQCERTAEGLTVYHPGGGRLTYSAGQLEAHEFHGVGCHEAMLQLGLPLADLTAKPEFAQQRAVVCQSSR